MYVLDRLVYEYERMFMEWAFEMDVDEPRDMTILAVFLMRLGVDVRAIEVRVVNGGVS